MPRAKKKTLAELIDEGADIKARLDAANKTADAIKKEKMANQEAIITELRAQNLEGSMGKEFTAKVTEEEVFSIEDFGKFEQFVYRKKAAFLFQRRLSVTSLRQLIEENKGRMIPGIKTAKVDKLSFTKRRS